jgi:U6 snRNA-associated Sm-like protein LSm4
LSFLGLSVRTEQPAAIITPHSRTRQTNGKTHPSELGALANLIQLVELKNGVTFNGHLVECDNFMNVTLREVYQTSADGEKFWKMKEMYIKGNVVCSLNQITVVLGADD